MLRPPSEDEVRRLVRRLTPKMAAYCRERFDLGPAWQGQVRMSFDPKRAKSWGGRRPRGDVWISLALAPVLRPLTGFHEYRRYAADPVIGSFATDRWWLYVTALLAHEFAHAVQFALPESQSRLRTGHQSFAGLGTFSGGHGAFYRAIYAELRRAFVNPYVAPGRIGAAHPPRPARALRDSRPWPAFARAA